MPSKTSSGNAATPKATVLFTYAFQLVVCSLADVFFQFTLVPPKPALLGRQQVRVGPYGNSRHGRLHLEAPRRRVWDRLLPQSRRHGERCEGPQRTERGKDQDGSLCVISLASLVGASLTCSHLQITLRSTTSKRSSSTSVGERSASRWSLRRYHS